MIWHFSGLLLSIRTKARHTKLFYCRCKAVYINPVVVIAWITAQNQLLREVQKIVIVIDSLVGGRRRRRRGQTGLLCLKNDLRMSANCVILCLIAFLVCIFAASKNNEICSARFVVFDGSLPAVRLMCDRNKTLQNRYPLISSTDI